METSLNKLREYKNDRIEEKIENDIEVIARYIADTSPFNTLKKKDEYYNMILTVIDIYIANTSTFDKLKMTDEFDNLILTSICFYLDYVYDRGFRNQLVNILVPMQMSSE